MTEHPRRTGAAARDLLRQLAPVDLVLIEGFKREPHPKLEVHRAANGKPWLYPTTPASSPSPATGRRPLARRRSWRWTTRRPSPPRCSDWRHPARQAHASGVSA
jgi:hypothetical protein